MKPLAYLIISALLLLALAGGIVIGVKVMAPIHERAIAAVRAERDAAIDKAKYERAKTLPGFLEHRLEYQRSKRTREMRIAHQQARRRLAPSRPDLCESCHERPTQQAHHPDYKKPLDVIWLCVRCHMRLHHSAGLGAHS